MTIDMLDMTISKSLDASLESLVAGEENVLKDRQVFIPAKFLALLISHLRFGVPTCRSTLGLRRVPSANIVNPCTQLTYQ